MERSWEGFCDITARQNEVHDTSCHRCGLKEDGDDYKICGFCQKQVLLECGCCAVTWCQATEGVCRDCWRRYPTLLNCDLCGNTVGLGGLDTVFVDDYYTHVRCAGCGKQGPTRHTRVNHCSQCRGPCLAKWQYGPTFRAPFRP